MRQTSCPTEQELRNYLQRDDQTNQSTAIPTHLVGCRSCRLDLLNWQQETAGLAESASVPPGLKRRVARMGTARTSVFPNLTGWVRSPSFALAALVLIVITAAGLWRYVNNAGPTPIDGDTLRAENRRTPSINPTFPKENAVVPTSTIVFSWTTDAQVIRSTVLILDEVGDIVYQAVTPSDQLTVDISQTQLRPQKKYFWHVRAKLADGTEVETKPLPFYVQAE